MKKVKEQLAAIPADYLKGINANKLIFYKGEGCAHCGNLGYRGRVAVAEIITVTSEIREVINRGAKTEEIERELKKQNFITLTQDCLIKALQGLTTLDETIRVSQI